MPEKEIELGSSIFVVPNTFILSISTQFSPDEWNSIGVTLRLGREQ